MLEFDRVLKAIKLDTELLSPKEALEVTNWIKKHLLRYRWQSCDERPYQTMRCLIAYSDGDVQSGTYQHNSDFDRGGFFTSMKEFDISSAAEALFWMPIPELPKVPSRVA